MNRREFILSSSAAVAGSVAFGGDDKTTDGGFAPVSWADRERRDVPVLPPGARSAAHFAASCVGCGLCAAVCPSKCLRPATDVRRLGRVELDYRHGWCKPTCVKCGEVCPAGAIGKIGFAEKRTTHVGHAVWRRDLCLRATEGVQCHACVKHCPVKAITLVEGFPVVNREKCVGCGACEHYCPVRPKTAMRIQGFEKHRVVRPIAEGDLVAEMRTLLESGRACVVAKDGVIVAAPEGRGVKPLLEILEKTPHLLDRALVMDKVCGRASAAICIVGGVRKVFAPVMGEDAKAFLEKHGIPASAKEVVPKILNRDHTGGCPMDAATAEISDPAAIVETLRTIIRILPVNFNRGGSAGTP